jgi:hypothetical protein
MFSDFFFWKAYRLCDDVEKYGTAGQAIDAIRRMCIAR